MTLLEQVCLESESKNRVKKLVLVSATFMPLTGTRKEAVEAAKPVRTAKAVEIAEVVKDDEENKGEYQNLA